MKHLNLKKSLMLLLVCMQLLSFGCTQPSNTTSITGQDLIEVAEDAEAKRLEEAQSLKEEFDNHFKNGLYFEDFTDIKTRLNEEFITYMEKEAAKYIDAPLFVQCDIEYLNASLKQAREEDWHIEKFLNDDEMHIRNMEVNVYLFVENEDLKVFDDTTKSYFEFVKEFSNQQNRFGEGRAFIYSRFYNPKVLEKETVDDLKAMEVPWFYLHKYDYYMIIDEDSRRMNFSDTNRDREEQLKEKYNEEFVVIRPGPGGPLCAPKENLDLRFNMGGSDKYLTVLTQKLITDEINQIIEEEGASDHLVQITTPKGNTNCDQDRVTTDTSHITDVHTFLNQIYEWEIVTTRKLLLRPFQWDYDTSMIYLLEPGEEVDYEELLRIHLRIADLLDEPIVHGRFVFFYEVDSAEDKQIITELIKRDQLTEYFYREQATLSQAFATMFITRADTDGFDYLDVYGRKKDYILRIFGDPQADFSPEKFKNIYTKKDIFRRD